MNNTNTDTDSFDYVGLGYNAVLLLIVIVNLIASLSVHFRFKSICESDAFKRVSSISNILKSPVISPPQVQIHPQNSQSSI